MTTYRNGKNHYQVNSPQHAGYSEINLLVLQNSHSFVLSVPPSNSRPSNLRMPKCAILSPSSKASRQESVRTPRPGVSSGGGFQATPLWPEAAVRPTRSSVNESPGEAPTTPGWGKPDAPPGTQLSHNLDVRCASAILTSHSLVFCLGSQLVTSHF